MPSMLYINSGDIVRDDVVASHNFGYMQLSSQELTVQLRSIVGTMDWYNLGAKL